MAASALLLGMLVLPSCGDSESNIAEEPGTEIDGGENDTIATLPMEVRRRYPISHRLPEFRLSG